MALKKNNPSVLKVDDIAEVPSDYNGIVEINAATIWFDKGLAHREDGPAYQDSEGVEIWLQCGKRHREDGPAYSDSSGYEAWSENDKYHRLYGPAIINADKTVEFWFRGEQFSRSAYIELMAKYYDSNPKPTKIVPIASPEFLPINFTGEVKLFNLRMLMDNGDIHSTVGPAVISDDGEVEYWIRGEDLTPEEFEERTTPTITVASDTDVPPNYTGKAIFTSIGLTEKKYAWYKNGLFHREYGPATEFNSGSKFWYIMGVIHRTDGPAEIHSKTQIWKVNGTLHREDGPAVEWTTGHKEWWIKGKKHREDGPAKITDSGSEEWYFQDIKHRVGGPAIKYSTNEVEYWVNGKRHRTDGPAVIDSRGNHEYWVNGKKHRLDGPAIMKNSEYQYWIEGVEYPANIFKEKMAKLTNSITIKSFTEIPKDFTGNVSIGDFYCIIKDGDLHCETGPAMLNKLTRLPRYFLRGEELAREEFQSYLERPQVLEIKEDKDIPILFTGIAFFKKEKIIEWWTEGRYQYSFKLEHIPEEIRKSRHIGPIVYGNGAVHWFQNEVLHREDGPAIEYPDGRKEYWFKGVPYATQAEFEVASSKTFVKKRIRNAEDRRSIAAFLELKDTPLYNYDKANEVAEAYLTNELCNQSWVKFYSLCWEKNVGYFLKITSLNKPREFQLPQIINGLRIVHKGFRPKYNNYAELPKNYTGMVEFPTGTWWYKNGLQHKEDGPAVIWTNGDKEWWVNGQRHRTDGPALVMMNGYKIWYCFNQKHRIDGPAVEFANKEVEYWLFGKNVSQNDFFRFQENNSLNDVKNTWERKLWNQKEEDPTQLSFNSLNRTPLVLF